jgi:hypothetical protein
LSLCVYAQCRIALGTYCINELSQHYFVINQLLLHISSNKKQKSQSVSFSSFLNFVSIIMSLHITLSNNKQLKKGGGSSFLFLNVQPGYPRMVRRTGQAAINLSVEEAAVHAGHRALVEFGINLTLIVSDPRWILASSSGLI